MTDSGIGINKFRVCYFGIYNPQFSRSRVYIEGLRLNKVEVIECQDDSNGLWRKSWRLWKKHRLILRDHGYDVLIVGYPGHLVVPLARLISKKKIIFDALGSLYEAEVSSHKTNFFKALKAKLVDWFAVNLAHVVLVESQPQKEYFIKRFGGPEHKYQVVYTGASQVTDRQSKEVKKRSAFTVLFRGSFTPESGLETIIEAFRIINNKYLVRDIELRLIGRGILQNKLLAIVKETGLNNIELITEFLPWPKLNDFMAECHVSLGQFSKNSRLERTIPHKAFESLALGLPYVTAQAPAIVSILTDNENCFLVNPADPDDLAQKILFLKSRPDILNEIGDRGRQLYFEKFTPAVLGRQIVSIIDKIL